MRFDLAFGAVVRVPNRYLLCKSLPDQSTSQNFASTAACVLGIGIIFAVTGRQEEGLGTAITPFRSRLHQAQR
jgi:hypothetical protein